MSRVTLPQLPDGMLRLSPAPRSGVDAPAAPAVNQLCVIPQAASGEVLGGARCGSTGRTPCRLCTSSIIACTGVGLSGGVAIFCVLVLGVKWRAGRARLHYDVHRAGGLWFWPVLAFALSGVNSISARKYFARRSRCSPPHATAGRCLADTSRPRGVVHARLGCGARACRASAAWQRAGEIRYTPAKGVYRIDFHTSAAVRLSACAMALDPVS